MMKITLQLTGLCAAAAGALALLAVPAAAAPVPTFHLSPHQQNVPADKNKNCAAAQQGNGQQTGATRPDFHGSNSPYWLNAHIPTLSPYLHTVLYGNEPANVDGSGPCRLVDSESADDVNVNEGKDVSKLLEQIDELLVLSKHIADDDEHELKKDDKTVHVEVGADGHTVLLYFGSGSGKNFLGQAGDDEWSYLSEDGADGHPGDGLHGDGLHGALSKQTAHQLTAVPEPLSYAMLLAGLALLGLARRRSRCADNTRA